MAPSPALRRSSTVAAIVALSSVVACSPGCSRDGKDTATPTGKSEGTTAAPAAGPSRQATAEDKTEDQDEDDYEDERMKLIDTLRAEGIQSDRVLRALREVPRHELVPERLQAHAYENRPLPIGQDQTISQPYIVALMSELADIQPDDKVLEIGTGSGYQAAVIGKLAGQVYTIEIIEPLGERAKRDLSRLGLADNIHFRIGDGYAGWPQQAPFDAILVTAAPPKIPQPLKEQLAVGGRMVVPVGEHYQELRVLKKTEEGIVEQGSIPVRFVPMTGKAQER